QPLYHLLFFFQCYGDHRVLLSFPTRRSSDLGFRGRGRSTCLHSRGLQPSDRQGTVDEREARARRAEPRRAIIRGLATRPLHAGRSEEHTSELQSRENLVCRLLLEKKKTIVT